jgi:hypothetical protein
MKKFKIADKQVKDAGVVFQVTGNHRTVKVVVRGEKQNLCDLLASAIEQSQAIREVVNTALAVSRLRGNIQGKGYKKTQRTQPTKLACGD